MTLQEFSTEFDVLYNNITSNQAPSLDDYEKSVFLTKAQTEVLKAYFGTISNKSLSGFDGNEIRQYDFSNITKTASLINVNIAKERVSILEKLDKRSQVFMFPDDYFISVNEIIFDSQQIYSVIPLQYEEYKRLMLKPYAYPVKKAAWRILTDKKNCNSVIWNQNGEEDCTYKILTSWADKKRNLSITIKLYDDWDPLHNTDTFIFRRQTMYFPVDTVENVSYAQVIADCGWSADKMTYEIYLYVRIDNADERDDENAFKIIKEGFLKLKKYLGDSFDATENDLVTAAKRLDLFTMSSAPSKFDKTLQENGLTLITNVIQVPLAEIIGKFNGDITYQMRYIKKPLPIILSDIGSTENTIDGISKATICELPEQLHYDILQRAVELAKASYTGDLVSQVSLGQNSETNMGINQQQR